MRIDETRHIDEVSVYFYGLVCYRTQHMIKK